MRIFNFLNKALTGYKTKSQMINGFRVDYKYAGKPILFDPFGMLKNLEFQYPNFSVLNSSPGLKKDLPAMDCLNANDLIPTVLCSIEIPQGKLKVKRFVKKSRDKSCSIYTFFLNDKKIAHFIRIYDYGETFISLLETQEIIDQLKGKEVSKALCFHFGPNEKFLIENFGHSHFWHIWDWTLIEDLNAIKK